MDSSIWIVFLPIIIVLIVSLDSHLRIRLNINRKKRSNKIMSNDIVKECIGLICTINMGYTGSGFNKVRVKEVKDNWMKVESNKGTQELINIDYIQNIKVISQRGE